MKIFYDYDLNKILTEEEATKSVKKEILDDASELFNQYRFKQGIEKLDSWILPEDADDLLKLIKQIFSMLFITYNYWDLFNHEIAEYAFNIHFYVFFRHSLFNLCKYRFFCNSKFSGSCRHSENGDIKISR